MNQRMEAGNLFSVRILAQVGMLSAISAILMLIRIPLWFAPSFYSLDLSEVPVVIGAFAMGPIAGVAIEFVKIVVNTLINGSSTAGIGELANFLIGSSFVVPAAILYRRNNTKKGAVISLIVGTAFMIVAGCALNAFILLPAYAAAFSSSIESLVAMGSAVNPVINSVTSLVLLAVAPFNLVKGVVVSIVVILLYKRVRPIIK